MCNVPSKSAAIERVSAHTIAVNQTGKGLRVGIVVNGVLCLTREDAINQFEDEMGRMVDAAAADLRKRGYNL